jgi:ferredoxin-NADP reductase
VTLPGRLGAGAPVAHRALQRPQLAPNAVPTERHDLTADIARFVVRPDSPVPAFEPGQYFSLGLELDGGSVLRPYSTASPRGATESLEFLVKRVATGTFTPALWDLRPGHRLWIGRPKGLFILKTDDPRTHLLVSAGTGIAPFISMLSELIGHAPTVVAHGVSHAPELAYRTWLESLAQNHSEMTYVPTVSRPNEAQSAGWAGRTGRVEQALPAIIEELRLEPGNTIAYLCGNPDMVERSREVLIEAGLPSDAIVHENYWATTATRAA